MSGQYPDRDPQMFYELARDRHAAQAEGLNVLDTKLVFFLSSSSALLALLVAVYALRPDNFDAWWEFVPPIASGAAWFLLTALALHAFKLEKWKAGPKLPQVFKRHSTDEDDSTLRWQVAIHFWHDYSDNGPLLDRKVQALNWALRLFVIQTVLLVAALVLLALDSHSDTSRRSQRPLAAVRHARVALEPAALVPERAFRAGSDPACSRSSGRERNRFLRGERYGPRSAQAASTTARERRSARPRRASIIKSA